MDDPLDTPIDPADDDVFDDDDGPASLSTPASPGEAFWPADLISTTASNPQPRARPPH